MLTNINLGKTDEYVYDISLDGSFVDAWTNLVVCNTDGFNYKLPEVYRYTDENPYIGKGLNRDVKKGEKYTGFNADVMEFDDLFMRSKMGLGIDEFARSTINLTRKNYMDYLEDGTTKKVGNTIKSKKMPGYIEKFIDKSADLLLFGKGKEFLDSYYDYIEKIYNFKIPLRDIASKGKIKKTLGQYRIDCNSYNKLGNKKPRQAWYELLLREDNPYVELGDTVYYINTGFKKNDSDVKKEVVYYLYNDQGEKEDITKKLNAEFNKYKKYAKLVMENIDEYKEDEINRLLTYDESKGKYVLRYAKLMYSDVIKDKEGFVDSEFCKREFKGKIKTEDVITLNCIMLNKDIVESDEDVFCDENTEYNVMKYIEMFNKRIKPLLVCFSKSIRDKILVTNPIERRFFTEEESKLTSGEPNKVTDQDSYEELMSMDRREVEFWTTIDEKPPFYKECGMDWDKIRKDFIDLKTKENTEKFKELDEKYSKCLENLTEKEVKDFLTEGKMPKSLSEIVYIKEDSNDLRFYFIELNGMTPTTGGYIFDDISYDLLKENTDEEEEKVFSSNEEDDEDNNNAPIQTKSNNSSDDEDEDSEE